MPFYRYRKITSSLPRSFLRTFFLHQKHHQQQQCDDNDDDDDDDDKARGRRPLRKKVEKPVWSQLRKACDRCTSKKVGEGYLAETDQAGTRKQTKNTILASASPSEQH